MKGGRRGRGGVGVTDAASDDAETVGRASEDAPSFAREVLQRPLEHVREQRADGLFVILGVSRGVDEEVGEAARGDVGEVKAHRARVHVVRDDREGVGVDGNHGDWARRRFLFLLGVLFRKFPQQCVLERQSPSPEFTGIAEGLAEPNDVDAEWRTRDGTREREVAG